MTHNLKVAGSKVLPGWTCEPLATRFAVGPEAFVLSNCDDVGRSTESGLRTSLARFV
jgi:hypothetical protein